MKTDSEWIQLVNFMYKVLKKKNTWEHLRSDDILFVSSKLKAFHYWLLVPRLKEREGHVFIALTLPGDRQARGTDPRADVKHVVNASNDPWQVVQHVPRSWWCGAPGSDVCCKHHEKNFARKTSSWSRKSSQESTEFLNEEKDCFVTHSTVNWSLCITFDLVVCPLPSSLSLSPLQPPLSVTLSLPLPPTDSYWINLAALTEQPFILFVVYTNYTTS